MKICHFTTVHNYFDVRILFRECRSLLNAGYEVDLIAPASEDKNVHGVNIIAIPVYKSRFSRILLGQFQVIKILLFSEYRLYHFHDPELIPLGLVLRILGKRVIYDIHENVSEQIKTKEWLPLRNIFSWIYRLIEYLPSRTMNLILAENSYESHYKRRAKNYRIVLNMPDLRFFQEFKILDRNGLENGIFYIGGISDNRGIFQVIKALSILKKRGHSFYFHCIGKFDEGVQEQLYRMIEFQEVSNFVTFYGYMDVKSGFEISKRCKVGISILKPIGNYVESYSTKIFEYMAVGLPVITSNFKLYRDVIERHDCGICPDPLNAPLVADAIEKILYDEKLARTYASNGRIAVESQYSWSNQEVVLLDYYKDILK